MNEVTCYEDALKAKEILETVDLPWASLNEEDAIIKEAEETIGRYKSKLKERMDKVETMEAQKAEKEENIKKVEEKIKSCSE